MQPGIYEKLLNHLTKKEIEKSGEYDTRKIDHSETPKVLSLAYQKMIREILSGMKKDERLEFISSLNEYIDGEDFLKDGNNFIELLAFDEDKEFVDYLKDNRPLTSIANSTLFTG